MFVVIMLIYSLCCISYTDALTANLLVILLGVNATFLTACLVTGTLVNNAVCFDVVLSVTT